MFAVRCRRVAAADVAPEVHRRAGPGRAHRHRPEQRAGLRRVPPAAVVAVRPGRGRSSGRRVHRAARRQVRAADRARRAGPGRPAGRAPRATDGPRLPVRSAATATGERRLAPRVPIPATAIADARRQTGRRFRLDRRRRRPFRDRAESGHFFFFLDFLKRPYAGTTPLPPGTLRPFYCVRPNRSTRLRPSVLKPTFRPDAQSGLNERFHLAPRERVRFQLSRDCLFRFEIVIFHANASKLSVYI